MLLHLLSPILFHSAAFVFFLRFRSLVNGMILYPRRYMIEGVLRLACPSQKKKERKKKGTSGKG